MIFILFYLFLFSINCHNANDVDVVTHERPVLKTIVIKPVYYRDDYARLWVNRWDCRGWVLLEGTLSNIEKAYECERRAMGNTWSLPICR